MHSSARRPPSEDCSHVEPGYGMCFECLTGLARATLVDILDIRGLPETDGPDGP